MKIIRQAQEDIFRKLYQENKGSPMAVSSESLDHKQLRFSMLAGLFADDSGFSLHDVGCGIADFGAFLEKHHPKMCREYSGTEILPEYIDDAKGRFPDSRFYVRDLAEAPGDDRYDYLVLSGVFHQRRQTKIPDWERFSQAILRNAFKMSKKGIGFNFISPFVDFYQEQVYYCNLPKLLNFIVDDLSRFFVIHHNYALFEFTVFVFQPDYIQSKYSQPVFEKYFGRRS